MIVEAVSPVAVEARKGLAISPRTLPPWLFYDQAGSILFEQITQLPEYYLTRTERALFEQYAGEILLHVGGAVTIVELGAGTATKTGILLRSAAELQDEVVYQPIDVSASALEDARRHLQAAIPGLQVRPQVANYITEPIRIERPENARVLALYIGSSIGNFAPDEARGILRNLRAQLRPGDALLLGTDLAPSGMKSVDQLLAAYDDDAGITAAFNRNILIRLNRELGSDFDLASFRHEARWNAAESRIEMHLVSTIEQVATLPADACGPALTLHFAPGESIHTENSYKFMSDSILDLFESAGFLRIRSFEDPEHRFAVSLASAV